jgi:hypothetical protein
VIERSLAQPGTPGNLHPERRRRHLHAVSKASD